MEVSMFETTAELDTVKAIWRDLLAVPEVSDDDDFFLLGGHSLLVLELAERVYDASGVQVPLRLFFDSPTPAALAAYVVEQRGDSTTSGGA
jgi:acyl carrier protein